MQFSRLPGNKLTDRHDYRELDISVEGCARLCMLQTLFKCEGFDYDISRRNCWLTSLTSEFVGGVRQVGGWDYYSRVSSESYCHHIDQEIKSYIHSLYTCLKNSNYISTYVCVKRTSKYEFVNNINFPIFFR